MTRSCQPVAGDGRQFHQAPFASSAGIETRELTASDTCGRLVAIGGEGQRGMLGEPGIPPDRRWRSLLLLVPARSVGSSRKENIPVDAPEQFVLDDPIVREANLRASMDAAVERLAHQLAEGHSDGFRKLLRFYSRFWTYSVRNCLLIHLQCPHATRCAGRYLWNKLGYHIERGQKAIWIWAPILRKQLDPDTGDEIKAVTGFRPAPVFDFSQLAERDVKPLPSIVPMLPDDSDADFQRCRRKVEAAGIEVRIEPLFDGALGGSSGGLIRLAPGLDSRNRLFVLLHELVHELWHQQGAAIALDRSKAQKEFEAESVAFVAAAVMGLEHPGARDYLLRWRATPEDLRLSLLTIQSMVRQVLVLLEIPFDVPHTPEALVA